MWLHRKALNVWHCTVCMYVYILYNVLLTLSPDFGSSSLLPWWQSQLVPFTFQMGLLPTVRTVHVALSVTQFTTSNMHSCNTICWKCLSHRLSCVFVLQHGLLWAPVELSSSFWYSWCCWWTLPTPGMSPGWKGWRLGTPGVGIQVSDSSCDTVTCCLAKYDCVRTVQQ